MSLHANVPVRTMYTKGLERTRKNKHTNFAIPLISKALKNYFTEILYYCFIETLLWFICSFVEKQEVQAHFSLLFLLKYCTKLDRSGFVNSDVL